MQMWLYSRRETKSVSLSLLCYKGKIIDTCGYESNIFGLHRLHTTDRTLRNVEMIKILNREEYILLVALLF